MVQSRWRPDVEWSWTPWSWSPSFAIRPGRSTSLGRHYLPSDAAWLSTTPELTECAGARSVFRPDFGSLNVQGDGRHRLVHFSARCPKSTCPFYQWCRRCCRAAAALRRRWILVSRRKRKLLQGAWLAPSLRIPERTDVATGTNRSEERAATIAESGCQTIWGTLPTRPPGWLIVASQRITASRYLRTFRARTFRADWHLM